MALEDLTLRNAGRAGGLGALLFGAIPTISATYHAFTSSLAASAAVAKASYTIPTFLGSAYIAKTGASVLSGLKALGLGLFSGLTTFALYGFFGAIIVAGLYGLIESFRPPRP